MLRISKHLDVEREFLGLREISDFDRAGPVEITAPEAIYTSPGGSLSEDFSAKEVVIGRCYPLPPEYATRAAPAMKRIAPAIETKGQVSAPQKNLLDIFFDWLNKILSGK